MSFVNQKLEGLGLSVQSLDTQVGTLLGHHAGMRSPEHQKLTYMTGSELSLQRSQGLFYWGVLLAGSIVRGDPWRPWAAVKAEPLYHKLCCYPFIRMAPRAQDI